MRHRVAVLNAVQFPLDPAVTRLFPDADPMRTVGFSKLAGERHYRRLKKSPQVQESLDHLKKRLDDPALAGKPIYCLGKDAEWFVKAALPQVAIGWIPHPSAWWRKGGKFEQDARAKLREIFTQV